MTGSEGRARGFYLITMVIIVAVFYSEATATVTNTPLKTVKQRKTPASQKMPTKCGSTIEFSYVCMNKSHLFSCKADTKFTLVDKNATPWNVTVQYKNGDVLHQVNGKFNVTESLEKKTKKTSNRTVVVECNHGNVSVSWRGTRLTISKIDVMNKKPSEGTTTTESSQSTSQNCQDGQENCQAGSNLQTNSILPHINLMGVGLVVVCGVGILTLIVTVGVALKHVTSGDHKQNTPNLESMWVSDTQRDADYDPMVHQPPSANLPSNPQDQQAEYFGSNPHLEPEEPQQSPAPPPPPPPPPPMPLPPQPPDPPVPASPSLSTVSTEPRMVYADLDLEEPCARDFVHVPSHTEYVTIDFNTRNPCIRTES